MQWLLYHWRTVCWCRRKVSVGCLKAEDTVFNGEGRKKKKQKKKIYSGEKENLAVAAPIAGEDLGSWGG